MRGFRADERAVSPVIGTILILFIILLSMAGILAWGVPAIQGLQEHAEFQSMLTQAHQLNADLLKLRDSKAASIATVSMNQGELRVDTGSRWVVTAFTSAALATSAGWTSVYWTGWENSDTLVVRALPLAGVVLTVDKATTSFTPVGVAVTCGAIAAPCSNASTKGLMNMTASSDVVLRAQLKSGGVLMAEAWFFDMGRITYKLRSDSTFNRIHVEMGAVFTQQGTSVFVDRKPAVKEPDFTISPADKSYLLRAFQLQQNTGTVVTGKGRHTINVNVDDIYGATRGRPYLPTVEAVMIQVDDGRGPNAKGTLEEGFCTYFDTLVPDYYTVRGPACNSGTADILYDPPQTFTFEISQAVVKANVKAV